MNALDELHEELEKNNKTIEDIDYFRIYKEGYNEYYKTIKTIDINDSIDRLNFDYDDGYGGQELFGYVVFKDKTWLERHEYDGCEWWKYKSCPTREEINE